eukprot:10143359-Karenia_brevis.AAC.1
MSAFPHKELAHFTSHQRQNMVNEVVQAFLRYILAEYNRLTEDEPEGWQAAWVDMHQCVNAIQHEIRSAWKGAKLCQCSQK